MARFLKRRWVLMALPAILGLVVVVSAAQAGKITLGTPVATSDGGLDVSVNVTPDSGQDVAALQFDLHYDSSRYGFTDAASGGAAAGAGKDTVVSDTEPGMVRVVVAGINQDTLGSGTVATLHFDRTDKTSTPPAFSDNALLDGVVASGPSGESIGGLDVTAAVSEVAPASTSTSTAASAPSTPTASATASGTSTNPTVAAASTQSTAGTASAGAAVMGTALLSASGRQASGVSSPRNSTGMGALVEPRGTAQRAANGSANRSAAAMPQTFGGVSPSRRGVEASSSGTPIRVASASSPGKSRTHEQSPKAAAGSPTAEAEPDAGLPSRDSAVSASGVNADRVLLAETTSSSRHAPALTAAKADGGAPKMKDAMNSDLYIFLVGSLVVVVLMLGAWVLRRS